MPQDRSVPLPKGWPAFVKSAVLPGSVRPGLYPQLGRRQPQWACAGKGGTGPGRAGGGLPAGTTSHRQRSDGANPRCMSAALPGCRAHGDLGTESRPRLVAPTDGPSVSGCAGHDHFLDAADRRRRLGRPSPAGRQVSGTGALPRPQWPRGAPCAKPWALVRGKPGAELILEVRFHRGRKHLPIVRLRRAA